MYSVCTFNCTNFNDPKWDEWRGRVKKRSREWIRADVPKVMNFFNTNYKISTKTTHYLLLIDVPWAVGGGQGGGAGLAVPGDVAILGGAADGQGVNAVCIAVTVAAVLLPPSIPRSPHKDGAQTATTLQETSRQKCDTKAPYDNKSSNIPGYTDQTHCPHHHLTEPPLAITSAACVCHMTWILLLYNKWWRCLLLGKHKSQSCDLCVY